MSLLQPRHSQECRVFVRYPSMGILGIDNRTENWTTAKELAPFIYDKEALLNLVQRLNPKDDSEPDEIQVELFWNGLRDRRNQINSDEGKSKFDNFLIDQYKDTFKNLRTQVESFDGFWPLRTDNYTVNNEDAAQELTENLIHTELDIVIQSNSNLYIGEAKVESKLGYDGDSVLVHQLIRQRVVMELLLMHENLNHGIRHFLILQKQPNRLQDQMRFAIERGWFKRSNILTWKDLNELAPK